MADQPFNIDLDALAQHIEEKLRSEKKSIRMAAAEIGCSPATLSRLLKGSETQNIPDTRTLIQTASWLGKTLTDFEINRAPATSTIADVVLHLRALPGLTAKDKEALVAMVRAMHEHRLRSTEG